MKRFCLVLFAVLLCFNVAVLPLVGYAAGGLFGAAIGYTLEELADIINTLNSDMLGDILIEEAEAEGWVYLEEYDIFLPGDYETATEFIGYVVNSSQKIGVVTMNEMRTDLQDAIDNATLVDEDNPLVVPGELFARVCDRLAEQYAPDALTEYISYQNEKHTSYRQIISFFSAGTFCGNSEWYDCYVVPFVYVDGQYYYAKRQYHYYQQDSLLYCDTYLTMDAVAEGLENYTPITAPQTIDLNTYRYLSLDTVPYQYSCNNPHTGCYAQLYAYKSYSDYIANSYTKENFWVSSNSYYTYPCDYMMNDGITSVCGNDKGWYSFYNGLDATIFPWDRSTTNDIGYFVSDEFITMEGIIQPIPPDKLTGSTVALTGDNVYEYTITTDTGGVTTMGDYIVNNYYVSGGDSSSGDSSGGSSENLPTVPNVQLDLDQYIDGVDDYVFTTEKFFQAVYGIIPEPIMNVIILSFSLLIVVGVIKVIFFLK